MYNAFKYRVVYIRGRRYEKGSGKHLERSYISMYSLCFVFLGMGLVSGSIVHMTIDPVKYTIVMIIGMIIFVVASLFNEIVIYK